MKYLIISHDADIDGMGPIILAKAALYENKSGDEGQQFDTKTVTYDNLYGSEPVELKQYDATSKGYCGNVVDYKLANYKNIDSIVQELMDTGSWENYDQIYITDVCPSREVLEDIDNSDDLREKFVVIDHHRPTLQNQDFEFVLASETFAESKTSATELFYWYMSNMDLPFNILNEYHPYLSLNIFDKFVKLTTISDTWATSSEDFNQADDLAELFNVIGSKDYINEMFTKLVSDYDFAFNDGEKKIIAARRKQINNACEKAYKTMKIKEVDGLNIAVCDIPYSFRNNFSQYLRDKNVEADIMAIADFGRGTMSYRTLSKKGDCNAFASRFGGGGHPAAAGSSITDELVDILELVVPEKRN